MENPEIKEYEEKRENLIKKDLNPLKYKNIKFSKLEDTANRLFHSKIIFNFNEDFHYDLAMKYKKEIESHKFFSLLKKMPKGCLLHHHLEDSIDINWISNIVNENKDNIYLRDYSKDVITKYPYRLIYTKKPRDDDKNIKEILNDFFKENPNKTIYDFFHEKLSMLPHELEKAKSNSEAFTIFMPKYFYCYHLYLYKNFFKQHLINNFQQCLEDKIYRLETRYLPNQVTDENLNKISIDEEFSIIKEALDEIRKTYKDFSFGIIIGMLRNMKNERIENLMKLSFELKKKYPDIICGMDLSGDEDHFKTFYELKNVLLKANDLRKEYSLYLPWILHCGESIRFRNQNLIDGYLLESKRFGHGINLYKYLGLIDKFKEKKICIEVNPISNQTLRNVRDLRMHPGISYLNYGINICISNDDPTIYNTKGVNYDFFVCAASMEFDLFDFKLIGLSSIDSAQISDDLKNIYKEKFLNEWMEFNKEICLELVDKE